MLYCIKTPEKKQLKSYIQKYVKDIPISSNVLQGSFSISNIRFYKYNIEVDVLFKGKMLGKMGKKPNSWLSSEILNQERVSKIRINRHIKKRLYDNVNSRLSIFGEGLFSYSYIKKIKWI